MMSQTASGGLVLSVPPERLRLARRTHRSVTLTFTIIYVTLAVVIIACGVFLAGRGRASLVGTLVVGGVFLLFPLIIGFLNQRSLKQALAHLSADGTTQMVIDTDGVRLADTFIPYERITFAVAFAQGEQYSSGGLTGQYMAANVGATDQRPTLGRAAGAVIGTLQRRKLYRDGAKSTIYLALGVDQRSAIHAPTGMVKTLKSLPQKGIEPGRIDIPFGAFLDTRELEFALGTMYRMSGGQQFPIGIVAGNLDWAMAIASAGETREEIWKTFSTLLPQR